MLSYSDICCSSCGVSTPKPAQGGSAAFSGAASGGVGNTSPKALNVLNSGGDWPEGGDPQGRLGSTAKFVDQFCTKLQQGKAKRNYWWLEKEPKQRVPERNYPEEVANRFRWQRGAKRLLGKNARIGLCRWAVQSKSNGVDLIASQYGDSQKRVHFSGLQTCGSVWACPVCGARICEIRRREMNDLISWARKEGYNVAMVTLTARHGKKDEIKDLLERMKIAKQRFHQRREYRNLKQADAIVGSVTASEVTAGGVNGWHPHFHVIVILDGKTAADLEVLRKAWMSCLRGKKVNLDGDGHAFKAQDMNIDENGDAARLYIAKWGAAEELTLSRHKRGKTGSRTPAQLLADYCDKGDKRAGALWKEYAEAYHGRQQLVWSQGLKAKAGIGEVSDTDAAQDQTQEEQVELDRANIPYEVWKSSVAVPRKGDQPEQDNRAKLLNRAAEIGVNEAAAELIDGHIDEPEVIEEIATPPEPCPGGLAAQALGVVMANRAQAPPAP